MIENHKHKLITCILPKGIAVDVIKKLKDEKGIITANADSARGMGKLTPQAHRSGLGEQTEKEILNVLVPADQSDELFEFIYDEAKINRPHGGIMYIGEIQQASVYELPDLPYEDN